jgi:hypothetical protein
MLNHCLLQIKRDTSVCASVCVSERERDTKRVCVREKMRVRVRERESARVCE